ncbi:MAG: 2-oxoacid:acceptor oxidoreductase family protein [Bacillota bacterium]
MTHQVIMAGFGGQGVMLMGTLLAYAGMLEGKFVSWIPSYGPEMRGGTANCMVVVSDVEVASPVVTEPNCVIVMNRPSLDKFERVLVPGGLLIINSSLISKEAERKDIRVLRVPCNDEATAVGSAKVANMVALGAYLAATGAVSIESVEKSLKKALPERRHDLIPMNMEALRRGAAYLSE